MRKQRYNNKNNNNNYYQRQYYQQPYDEYDYEDDYQDDYEPNLEEFVEITKEIEKAKDTAEKITDPDIKQSEKQLITNVADITNKLKKIQLKQRRKPINYRKKRLNKLTTQPQQKNIKNQLISNPIYQEARNLAMYKQLNNNNNANNKMMNAHTTAQVLKNGEFKDISKLNPKISKEIYKKLDESYLKSLILPELSLGAKVPSYFPEPTHSFHSHVTFNISTTTGSLYLFWLPYFLANDIEASSTNNVTNFYYATAQTTSTVNSWFEQQYTFNLPSNTASSYRLVSGSIQLAPEVSVLNSSGFICGGMGTMRVSVPSDIPFYGGSAPIDQFLPAQLPTALQAGTNQSNIDNLMFYAKANIQQQESLRHIVLPLDSSYLNFTAENLGHCGSEDVAVATTGVTFSPNAYIASSETYYNYYLTGLPTNFTLRVDLFLNFEITPSPSAYAILTPTTRVTDEDPQKAIQAVSTRPHLVSVVSKDLSKDLAAKNDTSSSLGGDVWGRAKVLMRGFLSFVEVF
jgi:hypothetical protein